MTDVLNFNKHWSGMGYRAPVKLYYIATLAPRWNSSGIRSSFIGDLDPFGEGWVILTPWLERILTSVAM